MIKFIEMETETKTTPRRAGQIGMINEYDFRCAIKRNNDRDKRWIRRTLDFMCVMRFFFGTWSFQYDSCLMACISQMKWELCFSFQWNNCWKETKKKTERSKKCTKHHTVNLLWQKASGGIVSAGSFIVLQLKFLLNVSMNILAWNQKRIEKKSNQHITKQKTFGLEKKKNVEFFSLWFSITAERHEYNIHGLCSLALNYLKMLIILSCN